jgi:hypothetical protein
VDQRQTAKHFHPIVLQNTEQSEKMEFTGRRKRPHSIRVSRKSNLKFPYPKCFENFCILYRRTSFAGQPETPLKFKSGLVQQPIVDLASVGCGIKQPGREEDGEMWTNGTLTIKTGWGTDNQGNVMAPNIIDHLPTIISQPSEWVNPKVQLDPNDPANAETLDKIEVDKP